MTRTTDKNRSTNPLVNTLGQDPAGWDLLRKFALWQSKTPRPLVQSHKDKFGPQNYCFMGHRRYWVWEFDGYRVFVSNLKGVVVETETLDRSDAEVAVKDYMARWEPEK